MSESSDRRPFIFGCVMFMTMEILALWIPRSIGLTLAVFIARVVDRTWADKSEPSVTLTAWLMKTIVLMVGAFVLSLSLQGIHSWYHSRS